MKNSAQKRGGDSVHLTFDAAEAPCFRDEGLQPDEAFDRQWALSLLEHVIASLNQEHESGGATLLGDAPFELFGLGADSEPLTVHAVLHGRELFGSDVRSEQGDHGADPMGRLRTGPGRDQPPFAMRRASS